MKNLTIHPVELDEAAEYWLDTGDGELRNLGNLDQVCELHAVLADLIDQGNHGGELPPDDPRIIEWITVAQAAEMSGESPVTIRWAARNKIEGALPRPWRFPKASFDAWMRTGRNKRS